MVSSSWYVIKHDIDVLQTWFLHNGMLLNETKCQFLIHCVNFSNERETLMRSITPILNTKGLSSLNDCAKVKLLLYGDDSFSRDENSIILKATLQFSHDSERFHE